MTNIRSQSHNLTNMLGIIFYLSVVTFFFFFFFWGFNSLHLHFMSTAIISYSIETSPPLKLMAVNLVRSTYFYA